MTPQKPQDGHAFCRGALARTDRRAYRKRNDQRHGLSEVWQIVDDHRRGIVYRDGAQAKFDRDSLLGPLENALRAVAFGLVTLASAMVASRL